MFRRKILLGFFAATFALLSFLARPSSAFAVSVDASNRIVESDLVKIRWDTSISERIREFIFKPLSATYNLAGAHDHEFFGNAGTFMLDQNTQDAALVASTNTGGTWQYSINGATVRVEIHSDNQNGVPITTIYEISDGSSQIKVTRTFGFSNWAPSPSRLVPFWVRAYHRDDFTRYAWEKPDGTVEISTEVCEFGCNQTNWKQTWIDLETSDSDFGIAIINLSGNPSSSIWLDRDSNSNTAWISAVIQYDGSTQDITVSYLIVPHLGDWGTIQAPTRFLDLPWDHSGKTFTDAAKSINAFFDHEYPLLSSGLSEPDQVITYERLLRTDVDYTSHDGYDYGTLAGAPYGKPVLAAADGCASYRYTGGADGKQAGGHEIHIDHGNGYQTRYLHLQGGNSLITQASSPCVPVLKGRPIGLVGYSGRVRPEGRAGAHLHFMVVQDKNFDGDFDDNIPDGVTDPFGWQSVEQDPWPNYSFSYRGQQRTGNRSFYLFTKLIASLSSDLTPNGGSFVLEHYNLNFPQAATSENLRLNIQASPIVRVSDLLQSIGYSIRVTAQNLFGSFITNFLLPFTINIDFSNFDISRYSQDTISIYSSEDGVNWTRESTTVDLVNRTASAQVNHLSYFALMAERADTLPPTTTATLSVTKGLPLWYRSDVTLTLNATDNSGGKGVAYTLYSVNGGEWKEYLGPVIFSEEGHKVIEFFSFDEDDNKEETKSVEFDIDKTPPVVSITANPSILWPPDGRMVAVTVDGEALDVNLLSTVFGVKDEYRLMKPTLDGFGQTILLEASRKDSDLDGRKYILIVTAKDRAGNRTTKEFTVVVPHDQPVP